MDLGIDKNLKIAEKYCFAEGGCKKLKGKTAYNERMAICAGCTNYLNKIDLVDLLNYYRNNTETLTYIPSSNSIPRTGKGTELSKTQIKKILLLYYVDGLSLTKIQTELGLQFRTVKNVINQSFKNETSNEKVKMVKEELEKDGLL